MKMILCRANRNPLGGEELAAHPSLSRIAALFGLTLIALISNGASQATACSAGDLINQADLGGTHLSDCTALDVHGYPPMSGPHYGSWAAFKTYTAPVSSGYFLHSEEHGAVVILYNCPSGCPDQVATLQALINSFPVDTLCTRVSPKTKRRVILAPDYKIDSTFAMAAWTWSLKTNCLDTAAMHAFYTAHYAHPPVENENLCNDGVDYSGNGWCGDNGIRGNAGSSAKQSYLQRADFTWEADLPYPSIVTAELFSMEGALLETQTLGQSGPGHTQVTWDGSASAKRRGDGPFLLRFTAHAAGATSKTKNMDSPSTTRVVFP